MAGSDVVELVSISEEYDAAGYPTGESVEEKREVFAEELSVKGAEFYAANQSGIKADIAFKLRVADYAGERLLEYEGKRYELIRHYKTSPEYIELTLSDITQQRM